MPTLSLHPSLLAAVTHGGLDPAHFELGVPLEAGPGEPRSAREALMLIGQAEGQQAMWNVPSLASLVRGNTVPPELKEYPAAYVPVFASIEQRLLMMASVGRPPTDGEIGEIYSNLRRRPDGRSGGWAHDNVWRIVAFTLGQFTLSATELEAVLGRLEKSAKFWKGGGEAGVPSASSRNYLEHLKKMFPRARGLSG